MDMLLTAGHRFSQEIAWRPQTQPIKIIFFRNMAVPATFQQNVDLMI